MWEDYELLDSGHLKKFERAGIYKFIRPEPQAIWSPISTNWQADAEFLGDEEIGHWKVNTKIPSRWEMHYQDIKFWAEMTPFRHLGFFPEQSIQWEWMAPIKATNVLNLFGYTGLASLMLAKNGTKVTHVDASKKAIKWARDNQALSKLEDKPIRWILDDVIKFTDREIRRNRKYDGIILDPPKFGHGPSGEIWKFEESLPKLLLNCKKTLSDTPKFIALTAYALRFSATSLGNLMQEVFNTPAVCGELTIKEKNRNIILGNAIYSRITF